MSAMHLAFLRQRRLLNRRSACDDVRIERQIPLTGTVTLVAIEGRRVMRLSRELASEAFEALLDEYQGLLRHVFESRGGHEVEVDGDTVVAAFPTARQAALAAVAGREALAAHAWSHGSTLAASIGLHSCETEPGWLEPALLRCSELCDAAEGGQIFVTQAASSLLDEEGLDEFSVRDLGDVPLRRREHRVRAYELVVPDAAT
jgi:class 3 adenylate cyclase